MLSEVNNAYDSGRIAGQIFVWAALLGGALKCWSISRRPATNAKCAHSLMIVLLACMVAGCFGTLLKEFGPSPAVAFAGGILGLGMIAGLVAGIVLAILGLVEYSKKRDVYTQGRAQAIWALALAGLICLTTGGGFIAGLLRANGFGAGSGQSHPGKVLAFDDLNFRFRSPDRPWVTYDSSMLNKDTKLSFTRRNPEAYFLIIAEKIGTQISFTTAQLAEIGKSHLQAAAASSSVVRESPCLIKGMNGLQIETEAQVGAYKLYYRNWYYATNGYAYQLISYSKSEDQQHVAGEMEGMLSRFELIDPNRMATLSGGIATNFHSKQNNYSVIMTNSAWHLFKDLEKSFPMAEFGLTQGDSCLLVLPVNLNNANASNEALVSAFLATMDIAYPNEKLTDIKKLTDGELRGQQFDFSRDVNGLLFHYRFKVFQGNGKGYLIAAWTQRRAQDIEPVLVDAISRVKFIAPTNQFALLSAREPNEPRAIKARGFILNQAGVFYDKQREFEQALPLFCAAAKANDQQPLYTINALRTWEHLDRPKEALAFIGALSATMLGLPEVRASQALFQAQASLTEPAITNYASLFATGFRNDSHFTEYINLLTDQKQYDTALVAIQNYLLSGDSIAVKLLEAQVYNLKKNWTKSIALLKDLHDKAPFNAQVAATLSDTFILAGQFTDALEIAQGLLKDNGNSAYYQYLKARSELGLKWYRESKSSFAEAARLAPANRDVRSYLNYVSGLLGEGDNTAVMDPIDPVVLPATLTNLPVESVPAGYARNYGAYYLKRIVAANYAPGKQLKKTEFMLARMLDASGVSAFSTVQVAFDPLTEQVFVNEVRVMDAEGKTVSTGNPANYYVLDDHSTQAASQIKVLNIPIPGLQPGCLLSVSITRQQQGHLKEFPFCVHSFASIVPIRESIFFLDGSTTNLTFQTSQPMQPEKLENGLCWRVQDPIVARLEPLQPPAADFLPTLWISDGSAKWPLLVSNYLATISDRLEADPKLRTQSQQMVDKLETDAAKISLLANYVQTNLTYKAIEFGRRASIPNKPADVVRNKYGDCKDHSILLRQMLDDAGEPAYLALVNHRGPIKKEQPSLDQFDHMIVYVAGSNGGRFLDCTSKGTDLANAAPLGLAGQEALILDARNPRFITVPQYPGIASCITVEKHVHLVDQTDLSVEESLTLSGVHAAYMRDYLLQTPQASRRTALQNMMEMSDADITDLQIDSLNTTGEPLRLRFAYSIKKQFRRSDNQIRGVLRAGFTRVFLTTSPVENRSTPFEIKTPFTVNIKEFIDVPTGFKAVQPQNLDVKLDPRFAVGHGNARADAGKVNLDFQCQLNAGKFEPSEYAQYRQTMSQAIALIEREFVFMSEQN